MSEGVNPGKSYFFKCLIDFSVISFSDTKDFIRAFDCLLKVSREESKVFLMSEERRWGIVKDRLIVLFSIMFFGSVFGYSWDGLMHVSPLWPMSRRTAASFILLGSEVNF